MIFIKYCCIIILCLLVGFSASGYAGEQHQKPQANKYMPNVFIRKDLEHYRIIRVNDSEIWRDGKKSGIFLRGWSGLPDHCWAIKYIFVWNDESPSPGHKPGTEDPEPLIVFISDSGEVVGVQSRLHGQWLPINSTLTPFDFVDRTHIMVGFAANVHTPGAGLFHTLLALGVGNIPSDLAAAADFLVDIVRSGKVHDGGH